MVLWKRFLDFRVSAWIFQWIRLSGSKKPETCNRLWAETFRLNWSLLFRSAWVFPHLLLLSFLERLLSTSTFSWVFFAMETVCWRSVQCDTKICYFSMCSSVELFQVMWSFLLACRHWRRKVQTWVLVGSGRTSNSGQLLVYVSSPQRFNLVTSKSSAYIKP